MPSCLDISYPFRSHLHTHSDFSINWVGKCPSSSTAPDYHWKWDENQLGISNFSGECTAKYHPYSRNKVGAWRSTPGQPTLSWLFWKKLGESPATARVSWHGPFHFLGNQFPMNFHFSKFFCKSQISDLSPSSLVVSEWQKKFWSGYFPPLFFLTGFSNFMIVCIDGKLRGSKSPFNSRLNCH